MHQCKALWGKIMTENMFFPVMEDSRSCDHMQSLDQTHMDAM